MRVITLTDASKFDTKALERIATIEKFKSEDKTIIFLTNFDTLEEARVAKTQTIQLGFKDAQVVEPKDGKFVKID